MFIYFQFLRNEATVTLGLSMLQITSEEFISPREDLNTNRKQELRTLLLEKSEATITRIMEILDTILMKFKSTANTVTPPPSPNNRSPFSSPCGSPTHNRSVSPLHGLTASPVTSTNAWLSPNPLKSELVSVPPTLDLASEQVVIAALSCINQFFSWMPLSSVLSPNLVAKFFLYAGYGCSALSNGSSEHKSNEIGKSLFDLGLTCVFLI